MPDIWLNMAIMKASMMTLAWLLVKNGTFGAFSAAASEESISWIWKSASSLLVVSLAMTSRPACSWPLAISQRGVSGTEKSMIRKIAAGMAMTPNIQRQSLVSSLTTARTMVFDR